MKALIIALLLLVTLPHADALIVSSEGRSFEEAKNNAFRMAVEYSVGAIVSAEQEIENNKIRLNEIFTYSSGYVNKYRVLKHAIHDGIVSVTLDVEISESRLKDFLLSTPNKVIEFESERHQTQINTYLHEREHSDRLLSTLLRHYPERAMDVVQEPYRLKTNPSREVIIEIPYTLKWNYDYLVALNNTLSSIQDGSGNWFNRSPGRVSVISKSPDNLLVGDTSSYHFNDLSAIDTLRHELRNHNEPRLLISITSYQVSNVINICAIPKYAVGRNRSFYRLGSVNEVVIFGNEMEKDLIHINLGKLRNVNVKHIRSIQVSVVAKKRCNIKPR